MRLAYPVFKADSNRCGKLLLNQVQSRPFAQPSMTPPNQTLPCGGKRPTGVPEADDDSNNASPRLLPQISPIHKPELDCLGKFGACHAQPTCCPSRPRGATKKLDRRSDKAPGN